jgi:hypothetical protein
MNEKKDEAAGAPSPVDGEKLKTKSDGLVDIHEADDALLAELGYKSEFRVGVNYLSLSRILSSFLIFLAGVFSQSPFGSAHYLPLKFRYLVGGDGSVRILYNGSSSIGLFHFLISSRLWYVNTS